MDRSETFTNTYQAMIFARLQLPDDEEPAMLAAFDAVIDRAARRVSAEQRARVAAAAAVFHAVVRQMAPAERPVVAVMPSRPEPAAAYAAPPLATEEDVRVEMHAHTHQVLSFARAQLADAEEPVLLRYLDGTIQQAALRLPDARLQALQAGLARFRATLVRTPVGWLRTAVPTELGGEEPHELPETYGDVSDYDPDGGEHRRCGARGCARPTRDREKGWVHVAEGDRPCFVLCPDHGRHVVVVARTLVAPVAAGKPS